MSDESEHSAALSVVIAAYNSVQWLPSSLESLIAALRKSTIDAEIVVVDDGSTDGTAEVLSAFAQTSPVLVRIVSQENKGRFLARWAGVQASRGKRILIFDSRLLMDENAFAYLESLDGRLHEGQPWNGHVPTDRSAPLVGRFWEVPTHLFWGSYLAHPAPTDITPANFDRVPKGTGCLLIDRELFVDACQAAWPDANANLVSDDTKLLRYVVERRPLRLDPGFGATYRPRVNVRSFLSHAYDRGTLFVDSYAGTTVARDIALFGLALAPLVALGIVGVAAITGTTWLLMLVLVLVVLGLVAPAIWASFRACPHRAVVSFLTFVVPFTAVFWSGLVRGIIIHRRSFGRPHPKNSEA